MRADLVRATVESIAYQTRAVADAMRTDARIPLASLRVDGGASAMDLLLQLQADLLGVPVARASVRETTALGAAYLAGLAAGLWGGTDELARHWSADRIFEPSEADRAEHGYQRWLR